MKPSGSYVDHFTVNSSTGALVDADSTPTASAYKNGVVDSGITVTVTKISTGSYKATCTVGSGYVSGDLLSVFVTCAVSSVTVGQWLKTVEIDTSFNSDVATAVAAVPTLTEIVDGLLDEVLSSHATVGSVAAALTSLLALLTGVNVTHINGAVVSPVTDLATTTDTDAIATLASAIKAVTDILNGMIAAGKFTAAALENAPSGGGGGSGSVTVTDVIYVTGTTVPIADVEVAIYPASDPTRAGDPTAVVRSNASGIWTADLDPGDYNRWLKKSGESFTNPIAFTVAAP